MQSLRRTICPNPNLRSSLSNLPKYLNRLTNPGKFSTTVNGGGFHWDDTVNSSWSTGLTKDQFVGEAVGHQVSDGGTKSKGGSPRKVKLSKGGGGGGWKLKEWEVRGILKQIEEPGARATSLTDYEMSEIYKKHNQNLEMYTIEKLAQDYRITRQRVVSVLWLKQDRKLIEKERGEPLDDTVELLVDNYPQFHRYYDREFHVAKLPHKPDFKVMPEGWDGTTRDPDEVHYEISKKEDDMMYEEFTRRLNFNKMKFKKVVKVHKYSRRRPSDGWEFVVTKGGRQGKRGTGGGWKFVSQPDGSTRPLNEVEKMYVKRETPLRRRKILS